MQVKLPPAPPSHKDTDLEEGDPISIGAALHELARRTAITRLREGGAADTRVLPSAQGASGPPAEAGAQGGPGAKAAPRRLRHCDVPASTGGAPPGVRAAPSPPLPQKFHSRRIWLKEIRRIQRNIGGRRARSGSTSIHGSPSDSKAACMCTSISRCTLPAPPECSRQMGASLPPREGKHLHLNALLHLA